MWIEAGGKLINLSRVNTISHSANDITFDFDGGSAVIFITGREHEEALHCIRSATGTN